MPYADGNPTLTEQLEEDERRRFYTADLIKEARELVQENKGLRQALDDIAKGMVPAREMPSLDDKHEFRYGMWQWSQRRARTALSGEDE